MGKPSGFLEYPRRDAPAESPAERAKHWNEFHTLLPAEERQRQGARCMACGVPFCQSGMELAGGFTGCPLRNLIPEWNDLVYSGNYEAALKRLTKTNNFPEFTGRVCPALCESACTCSLNGEAVTTRQNELGIIEEAFRRGLMVPRIPRVLTGKRVAIVGSGPAGLAAAAQLRSRGHAVTVYEKSDRPGGLLMYGIPNMKLEKSVVARRVALMEAEGVEFVLNTDVGRDIDPAQLREHYDAVVICAGAGTPKGLDVPGAQASGVHYAVDYLTRSTKALLENAPNDEAAGKDVIVIGGGDTGADCVATAVRQGCRSILQLGRRPCPPMTRSEKEPWPLWPKLCQVDYGQAEAIALLGRDPKLYQCTVKALLSDESGALQTAVTVRLEPKRNKSGGRDIMVEIPGTEEEVPCQLLLIAGGFSGVQAYVAQSFGLELDRSGNIRTQNYASSLPGVFAAGDARRGQSLVVWAIREGRECAARVDEFLMGYTNL